MALSRRTLFEPTVRETKTKKTKRHTRLHTFIVWICVVLGVILLLALISRQKGMIVDRIVIRGNNIVDEQAIRAVALPFLEGSYIGLFPKNNSLLVPADAIEDALRAQYPRFSDVSVARNSWKGIVITVAERDARYLLCKGAHFSTPCFGVDKTGYIFGGSPEFSGALLFALSDARPDATAASYSIGSTLLAESELSRIDAFARRLPELFAKERITVLPKGAEILGPDSYKVIVEIGTGSATTTEILFDGSAPEVLAHNLSVAMSSERFRQHMTKPERPLVYIDLRFGNKVYFKFKGEEPLAETSGG